MINDIERYIGNLREGIIAVGGNYTNRKYVKLKTDRYNIDKLLEFDSEMATRGLKVSSRATLFFSIIKLMRFIGMKKFSDVTRKDILDFFESCRKEGLKENTLNSIVSRTGQFFLWLNGGKQYPACVDGLKAKRPRNRKLPEDIVNEEDIRKMIDSADRIRDKAIVSCLYESGCRAAEFLGMKIGDLQFDDYGCKIVVDGKTGQRCIRLVDSVPLLKAWLRHHPKHEDPKSSLWLDMYNQNKMMPMQHSGLWKTLLRLGKKIGLAQYDDKTKKWIWTRKPYPHSLRHRRLTELSKRVPESVLRKVAGWTEDSTMVKTYVHLNGQEVDDVVLSNVYGKTPQKVSVSHNMQTLVCNTCEAQNKSDAEKCWQCGTVFLDIETAEKLKQIKENIVKIINENPQLLIDALKRK